jgi:hypothetical protein
VQCRSVIINCCGNQPAEEKAFPDRKASVKLMIAIDVVPSSFPVGRVFEVSLATQKLGA